MVFTFNSKLFSSKACTFFLMESFFSFLSFAVEAVYYKVELRLLLFMFIYQRLWIQSIIWSSYPFAPEKGSFWRSSWPCSWPESTYTERPCLCCWQSGNSWFPFSISKPNFSTVVTSLSWDNSASLHFSYQLVSLVVTQFRSHISKALILTNRLGYSGIWIFKSSSYTSHALVCTRVNKIFLFLFAENGWLPFESEKKTDWLQ